MIISDNMQRSQDYVRALEEERRKIQVFERELPLCLELVTQAIEACKQQFPGGASASEYDLLHHHRQSECNSEQTSSDDGPVLEEFIPIKRPNNSSDQNVSDDDDDDDDDDDEVQESKKLKRDDAFEDNLKSVSNGGVDKHSKKSDWLRSAQLWNQTLDPPAKEVSSPRKVPVVEVKRNGMGGAFHPFKKERSNNSVGNNLVNGCINHVAATINSPPPPATTSSTAETGGNKKEAKDELSQRKARRCWSPELHKRFLQALHQLGGSHVATPKQIRELMKVDGLTNDEVKSHLQKYRLHTRRPSPSTQGNNNLQTPQFVVVGGIWVPPEYAATVAASTVKSGEASGNGIYAPIPKLPPPSQEASKPNPRDKYVVITSSSNTGNNSEENVQSHSPATSSSTHTTTASPAY